jgi:hypothetical protein
MILSAETLRVTLEFEQKEKAAIFETLYIVVDEADFLTTI